jgi:Fur family ferric uptake transcriptional regulator
MNGRGRAWAERAYRELAAGGHRAGGARAAVIEALATGGGCCTAGELTARLAAGPRPVGTASLYRALTALQEAGLVHSVDLGDGERRWELVHEDGAHHHHLVCDRCGRTASFDDAALEAAVSAVAERLGARLTVHDVVLHGRCSACGGRPERGRSPDAG